jgi:protein-S-isoprenylcysteine O-methyltransferase Ste14
LIPLIFSNPAASVAFIAACLIWIVPEMIGTGRQMARVSRRAAAIEDRGSMAVLIGLQWVGLALNFSLAWLFPAAAIPQHRTVLFLLGLIFIALGVALRWFSIWTLGSYFTRDVAVSSSQQVVERGPYRLIRHPAYSGTLLTMLGVGLAITNWASLTSLLLCVFLGHLYRVRIEEQALIHTVGPPYIEYMRRTKRFIPRIY